jgi:hypothetical protein
MFVGGDADAAEELCTVGDRGAPVRRVQTSELHQRCRFNANLLKPPDLTSDKQTFVPSAAKVRVPPFMPDLALAAFTENGPVQTFILIP